LLIPLKLRLSALAWYRSQRYLRRSAALSERSSIVWLSVLINSMDHPHMLVFLVILKYALKRIVIVISAARSARRDVLYVKLNEDAVLSISSNSRFIN